MLKEIDLALTSHGLIKVRAGGDDREAREAMLSTICDTLSCAPVHHLGKTLILFRPLAGNIKPPVLAALEPERPAKRRASEPHTPKKLAAEGKTLAKRPRRSETEEPSRRRASCRRTSSTRTASRCVPAPRKPLPAATASAPRRQRTEPAGRARSGTSRKSSPKR
ncbi:YhbY family RNA-binding protein [Achromobacter insuavis]